MAQDKKVEQITSMEDDFAQWYTDICKKAELIDYSSVKGFMILRPYGYAIWENIQKILDDIDELRYSPDEERYREEDECYLGAICIMPLRDSDSPEHAHDMALLDGQQRLTSLMILARVLYERAMRSKTDVRRKYRLDHGAESRLEASVSLSGTRNPAAYPSNLFRS